jgi:hypothetical protein
LALVVFVLADADHLPARREVVARGEVEVLSRRRIDAEEVER